MPDGAEGVLLAMGSVLGGWSLHVIDGRLRYVHNYVGKELSVVTSSEPVPSGRHTLGYAFAAGVGRVLVDGEVVGEGPVPRMTLVRYSITGAGLCCGWEQGPPVGEGYAAPFRFTGRIVKAVVEVDGQPHRDPRAEFEAIMSEQ